jgi:hypothetical protein
MAKRANGVSEFVLVNDVMNWNFGGKIVSVSYNLANVPEWPTLCEFTKNLIRNGAKQKIADSMAIQNATVEEKAAAARETALNLTKLIYRGDRGSMLATALQSLYPTKSAEFIADWMRGLSDEEVKDLKNDPRIKAEILKIQESRVDDATKKKVDGILAGMEEA